MASPIVSLSCALGALFAVALSAAAQESPGPRLTAEEVAARRERAGNDPVALLELVALVGETEARGLRQQLKTLLADRKQIAGPEEQERLLRGVARVLPAAARTPAALRELLGPPRQVLRQVLYRRYREQWHYDTPLSVCVVLEGARGQEARVRTVLVPGGAKP
jgi:hypothetical protein